MDRLLIAITPLRMWHGEAKCITAMLDAGIDVMHVRHPGASVGALRGLLAEIPEGLHHRLRLHDGFELAEEFDVGGLHLNVRNPESPAGYGGGLSRSCHSMAEVRAVAGEYDYVTLSPIFPSISKPGYGGSVFTDGELAAITLADRVVALGGVSPERIGALRGYNFMGYAMLGALWGAVDPVAMIKLMKKI